MQRTSTMAVVGVLLAAGMFAGCSKSNQSVLAVRFSSSNLDTGTVSMNVEIKEIWIKVSRENTGWFFLKSSPAQINLSGFAGKSRDTFLASGEIPQTEVREVRIIFGDHNTITTRNGTFPLEISANLDGGAKVVQVRQLLQKPQEVLGLKLNPAASVTQTSPGHYVFNPVFESN